MPRNFNSVLGKGAPDKQEGDIIFYLQCGRCGEKIKLRISRKELQPEYDGESETGYLISKDIVGKQCPNLMRLTAQISSLYDITFQEVTGGRLISEREYRAGSE